MAGSAPLEEHEHGQGQEDRAELRTAMGHENYPRERCQLLE
jgi:hypothetical protein